MQPTSIGQPGWTCALKCRVCGEALGDPVMCYPPMPLANVYVPCGQAHLQEQLFPLSLSLCAHCGLVQLCETVDREQLFGRYPYLTGASAPLRAHFAGLATQIGREARLARGSLVVDIGSNDGTLLGHFMDQGMRVLGVDPAGNAVEQARVCQVETERAFFGRDLAVQLRKRVGTAKAITATNVLAHVADLHDFIEGVLELLDADGVFVVEVPYLGNLVEGVLFDTVYHEHLCYFSLHPLCLLFRQHDLSVTRVEQMPVHGGSLRLFLRRGGMGGPASLTKLLEEEQSRGLLRAQTYERFWREATALRSRLRGLLDGLKQRGAVIAGYGAPAKGNVLLNFCSIGPDTVEYLVDTTPFKQGTLAPGSHIPIFEESHFRKHPPDYALILPWNYAEHIVQKERAYRESGGKFIVPIPAPAVI
ncbi:MAG: methyltransferase domain-containing protein [Chloroflexota bacterium]